MRANVVGKAHPHARRGRIAIETPTLTRSDAGFIDPLAAEGDAGRHIRFSSEVGCEGRGSMCGRPRSPYPRP